MLKHIVTEFVMHNVILKKKLSVTKCCNVSVAPYFDREGVIMTHTYYIKIWFMGNLVIKNINLTY